MGIEPALATIAFEKVLHLPAARAPARGLTYTVRPFV